MFWPLNLTLPAGGRVEPQHRPAGGGLAAAGLADQPHRFASENIERHVIHRLHGADLALKEDAPSDGKMFLEVFDTHQDFVAHHRPHRRSPVCTFTQQAISWFGAMLISGGFSWRHRSDDEPAARRERATFGEANQVRRHARDRDQAFLARHVHARQRAQE